ncbi:MAG: hypothetical protein AAB372_00920 [Patescibacteria group bacterium]
MKYGELDLGQVEAIVNKLGGMEGVHRLLSGRAEVTIVRHIIDCDVDPFTPDGWKVEEHKKGGQFEWGPAKVSLHLSPNQKDGKVIEGNKLRKELAREPMLNANVLDYFLANQYLIPEEWKGKAVFFWGTIYRRSGGRLFVRCLYFDGGRWDWSCSWLDDDWDDIGPAARLAS